MVTQITINIGSGNALLPGSTKKLSESLLILLYIWTLVISYYSRISLEEMS